MSLTQDRLRHAAKSGGLTRRVASHPVVRTGTGTSTGSVEVWIRSYFPTQQPYSWGSTCSTGETRELGTLEAVAPVRRRVSFQPLVILVLGMARRLFLRSRIAAGHSCSGRPAADAPTPGRRDWFRRVRLSCVLPRLAGGGNVRFTGMKFSGARLRRVRLSGARFRSALLLRH